MTARTITTPGGSGGFTGEGLGVIEPLDPAKVDAARRVVAGRARDAEDAGLLLAALGLDGAA